jgi:hypothetical protein
MPSTTKKQQLQGIPTQSKKMRVFQTVEMSTTFGILEVPFDLEPRGKMDYLEIKAIYKNF